MNAQHPDFFTTPLCTLITLALYAIGFALMTWAAAL